MFAKAHKVISCYNVGKWPALSSHSKFQLQPENYCKQIWLLNWEEYIEPVLYYVK